MQYRIGCSGYYYPQWKGKLYPIGVAPKNWLRHYSNIFNTVELNGTFYRQPKPADLKKYASVTPDSFTFSVKMSRYITHVQRFKEKQTILDFQHRVLEGLGSKLQHFLFQTPANYKFSEENLEQIIESVPHSARNVIEFRDISWWNQTVQKAFAASNITFCNVDFPKLESRFMQTSSCFYLRLHGNPELFKTRYTLARLKKFYQQFPPGVDTITVYFNNTVTEAGFENALQLMKIIS